MSKKRRVSFRLAQDEALVIAPVSFWIGTADWFNGMAEDDPDRAEEWHQCAAHINDWLERTQYIEPEEQEV